MHKVGDSIIFRGLPNYYGFEIGHEYTINSIIHSSKIFRNSNNYYYHIMMDNKYNLGVFVEDKINEYFYTEKEIRKLKLEKINNV